MPSFEGHSLDTVGGDVQSHRELCLAKRLTGQPHITGAALDQENLEKSVLLFHWLAYSAPNCCGNLTLVSQKSLMLLTSVSKSSS